MPGPWKIDPAQFDGGKFAKRYALDPFKDFEVKIAADGQWLHVRHGVIVPDQPVFEPPSPPEDVVRARQLLAVDPLLMTPAEVKELVRLVGRRLYGG